MDDNQKQVLIKVEKLMRLAGGTSSPEEAASAAAKAQELLTAYNLDVSILGTGIETDVRAEEKMLGGFYDYQREVWSWVAELNFCLYWTQKVWMHRRGRMRYVSQQRIIGRKVNVAATKAMAGYLLSAIERNARAYMAGGVDEKAIPDFHLYMATRRAMSFREGCSNSIVWALYERRQKFVEDEKKKEFKAQKEAAQAASEGVSTSTAMTVASLVQSEKDANMDFIRGSGWSAKQRAERIEQARIEKEAEDQYAAWALAHPEEAAREEASRLKQERKHRPRQERMKDRDWGAYARGEVVGKTIGLDQQAEAEKRRALR